MDNSEIAVSTFLNQLVGTKEKQADYEMAEAKKKLAFEEMLHMLTPEVKMMIAEGMKFSVVDKKGKKKEKSFSEDGQEYAIDTFGSTKKGHGLSSDDHDKVYKAMGKIVEITRKAIDKVLAIKNSDGTPVYDIGSNDAAISQKAQEDVRTLIELEVFSPLVREKLLPETFVLDDYSEVQKLLDNTFKQYGATTKEEIVKKEERAVDDQINFDGGRLKADMLKGFGAKAGQMKDHLIAQLAHQMDISEKDLKKLEKGAKYAKQGASVLSSMAKAGINVKGYTEQDPWTGSNKNLAKEQRFLWASDDHERLQAATDKRSEMIRNVFSNVQDKLNKLIGGGHATIDVVTVGYWIDGFLKNVIDSDPFFYTTSSVELLVTGIMDGIEIGGMSASMYANDSNVKKILAFSAECQAAPERFDQAVCGAIGALTSKDAESVFANSISDRVEVGPILKASSGDRGELIASKFAKALEQSFAAASPKNDLFGAGGKSVSASFLQSFSAKQFEELAGTPATAFEYLYAAGKSAVDKGLSSELKQELSSPEKCIQMIQAMSIPPEAFQELEESEEELLEYERALVLIDEGGVTMAEQKSIEKLIEGMEKDRQTLELVAKIGSGLSSLGSNTVGIANWATDKLTDVVAGEIVGPLKAAQLVMQLSVNVIKAAGRMSLLMKFQQDLARSKTAVSSLTSTIQGFLDNKKEQITFRTIEDALIGVQAAGAILGSIPEPHAMAIGKTLGLVASAAQEVRKISEMAYNDKKLSEAWGKTKAAMENPRDRGLGLSALRLNPTLGMHAVAWAGMEKRPPDPIARMFLDSVGLNEQTLAVSGTEAKVRKYLETLLNEDRKMIDPSKINVDWAPDSYALTTKDWFMISSRAQTVAPTKLRSGPEKTVLECLKLTDKHQLATLQQRLDKGIVTNRKLDVFKSEIKALLTALNNYSPKTVDGAEHEEMGMIADNFILMAKEHEKKLEQAVAPIDGEESLKILRSLAKDVQLLALNIDPEGELMAPRRSGGEVLEILKFEAGGIENMKERANQCNREPLLQSNPQIVELSSKVIEKIALVECLVNKEETSGN